MSLTSTSQLKQGTHWDKCSSPHIQSVGCHIYTAHMQLNVSRSHTFATLIHTFTHRLLAPSWAILQGTGGMSQPQFIAPLAPAHPILHTRTYCIELSVHAVSALPGARCQCCQSTQNCEDQACQQISCDNPERLYSTNAVLCPAQCRLPPV